MNRALLLIDIQNDYFPGGKYGLFRPDEAADKAALLLEAFRARRLSVVHVQHVSLPGGAAFFLPDTEGVRIHAKVSPLPGEPVVIKHAPDGFLKTDLKEVLDDRGVDHLVVCGMMSHMCIDTTVRAAKGRGYGVTLVGDACTTRDLVRDGRTFPAETVHAVFMAALRGTFAEVVPAGRFLEEAFPA